MGLGEPRESGSDEEASSAVTAGKMSFFDAPEPPARFLASSERATALEGGVKAIGMFVLTRSPGTRTATSVCHPHLPPRHIPRAGAAD